MFCPKCGYEKTKVYGTRKGLVNERFRECERCGYRFLTIESVKADEYPIEYKKYLKEIGEEKSLFDEMEEKDENKQ